MKIAIKHRYSGAVLFECEASSTKEAVCKAIASDANLSGANLSGANLIDANLSHANLSRANLSRANLSRANLSRANLSGANLSDANLSDANLSRANLSGANLSDANLSGANLSDANLSRANLSGANLSRANLIGANLIDANLSHANLSRANLIDANLSGAIRTKEEFERVVPLVADLDAKILALIESGDGSLDMSTWHRCETTHCRAGWAVTLGGEKARELEKKVGTSTAGAFIYWRAYGYVPNFYATDEEALADIVANVREVHS